MRNNSVVSEIFVEGPAGWTLYLAKPDISWIRIDFQTRIQMNDLEFVIECPFQFTRNEDVLLLDPNERERLGPFLAIYPGLVSEGWVSHSGCLNLAMGDGTSIVVEPDPRYEAWQIVGPNNLLVVCTPGGGEPAIWNEHSEVISVRSLTED